MKKIMIVVAIVCAAAMSQAASCAWKLTGDADHSPKGHQCYIFRGDVTTAIAEAFANDTIGGVNAFNAYILKNAPSVDINPTKKTTSDKIVATGVAKEDFESVLTFVVLNGDLKAGETYEMGTVSTAGKVFMPPPEGQETAPATGATFTYTGAATGTIADVSADTPEPTSGLLLLLGVAGLALRRRRA